MTTYASMGGLTGLALGIFLVDGIGHVGLLILAALLLLASAHQAIYLHRWRRMQDGTHSQNAHGASEENIRGCRQSETVDLELADFSDRPLGGSPFAGASAVFRSPYLRGIAFFVLLLASSNTFLYFEQMRLVAEYFPDPVRQTQVFALLDILVQTATVAIHLFFAHHFSERIGIVGLLAITPLAVAIGFLLLALAPFFTVFVVVSVLRRVGEHTLVRPGRELLYTGVPNQDKYKAKSFIDTVVHRSGDALAGWARTWLDQAAAQPILFGGGLALAWAISGYWLGKRRL